MFRDQQGDQCGWRAGARRGLKVSLPARSPEPTGHGEDLEEIHRRILSKGVMSSDLGFKRVILLNFILVFCYLNV